MLGFFYQQRSKFPLALKFLITKLGYSSSVTSLGTMSDAARFYTNIPERAEMGQYPAFKLSFPKGKYDLFTTCKTREETLVSKKSS